MVTGDPARSPVHEKCTAARAGLFMERAEYKSYVRKRNDNGRKPLDCRHFHEP